MFEIYNLRITCCAMVTESSTPHNATIASPYICIVFKVSIHPSGMRQMEWQLPQSISSRENLKTLSRGAAHCTKCAPTSYCISRVIAPLIGAHFVWFTISSKWVKCFLYTSRVTLVLGVAKHQILSIQIIKLIDECPHTHLFQVWHQSSTIASHMHSPWPSVLCLIKANCQQKQNCKKQSWEQLDVMWVIDFKPNSFQHD